MRALAGAGAAAAGLALVNAYRARRAEWHHPPQGRFVEVAGTRLHYLERGRGSPVVLLHGNLVTSSDWAASGVLDRLASSHRVLAFDRPGFGYSTRPRGAGMDAGAQAVLIRSAWERLGVRDPVLVGHSWGVAVALAAALADPATLRGLVLISGYYHPTTRIDAAFVAPAAMPVVGTVLRHTISPIVGAALLPAVVAGMFAPRAVPERFSHAVPGEIMLRPSQLRAEAEDGAIMVAQARSMRPWYRTLAMPVAVMAGVADRVVAIAEQSVAFQRVVPDSELCLMPRAGHMVHHAAPDRVAELVRKVLAGSSPPVPDRRYAGRAPQPP